MQLMQAANSMLLVVDIQEKLLPTIHNHTELIAHCAWLMRLANALQVPLFISEQYPQGLGRTAASLLNQAPTATCLDKVEFSCAANLPMLTAIEAYQRQQIIICGIETHVCVLQTALDFANRGKHVYVVADATSTRTVADKFWALERLQRHTNIQIVTHEMVLFEWLGQSGTTLFKEVSKTFLKGTS
jgi:nicotinamidase-related amidase